MKTISKTRMRLKDKLEAIRNAPLMNRDEYNWINWALKLGEPDMYAASAYYAAGYIEGIRAERARRKKKSK